jgi:hypothetical protein
VHRAHVDLHGGRDWIRRGWHHGSATDSCIFSMSERDHCKEDIQKQKGAT